MPYINRGGVRLFYETQGSGDPPLLFVHGFGCTHEDWQSQVDFFRTRHRVVTCDIRGHGASDRDPKNCDIETLGADVGALLDALDLRSAVLVGHSMGCRVVLQANRQAAPRIAGLILVDGSRSGFGDPEVVEQKAREGLEAAGYSAVMQRLFSEMFLDGCDPDLRDRLLSRAQAFPEEVGAALLPRFVSWDARHGDDALAQVSVPVLALQSTYVDSELVRVPIGPDTTIPWLDLLRHYVSGVRIEIISGIGHFSMLEAPDAVNRSMASFIGDLPA